MVHKPPRQPSGNRFTWLPFVCAGFGLLIGGAIAFYLACLRVSSGEYNKGGEFGDLGRAFWDLLGYPILGAFIGVIVCFRLGKAILDTLRRPK